MKEIKIKLDNKAVVLDCYECGNKSVVPNEDSMEMECLFCSNIFSEDRYEKLYCDMRGAYGHDAFYVERMICSECEGENCFVETKDKEKYFCLYCHHTAEKDSFVSCPGCGVLYEDSDPANSFQCSSCWQRLCQQ